MSVTARLFARDKIAKIGLAPLTSMYDFGENQPGREDYRPEVHDSTVSRSRAATANGSGVRSSIRAACSSPRSARPARSASA